MQPPESYGSVKYGKLQAALQQIADHFEGEPEKLADVNITFEYLIGSFFPTIVKNVHDEANKQYTAGYLAGYAEGVAAKGRRK